MTPGAIKTSASFYYQGWKPLPLVSLTWTFYLFRTAKMRSRLVSCFLPIVPLVRMESYFAFFSVFLQSRSSPSPVLEASWSGWCDRRSTSQTAGDAHSTPSKAFLTPRFGKAKRVCRYYWAWVKAQNWHQSLGEFSAQIWNKGMTTTD